MIIWLNGTYGVGKTTLANKISEKYKDYEILDSDSIDKQRKSEINEKYKNNTMEMLLHIGEGTVPQNNIKCIEYIRETIEEKLKINENLIVVMALTNIQCKEKLLDTLTNKGIKVLHIILNASENTIKKRVKVDQRRDILTAESWYLGNSKFLNTNFPEAIRIDTNNKDINEVATEVIKILENKMY